MNFKFLTICLCPSFDFAHFWHYDCHATIFQRVTIKHALGNVGRKRENIFDFFWRDVFSLRQLEDVLTSINDLDRAVGVHLADITSQEPTVFKRLSSLVGTFVVASCDCVSLHAELTTGVRLVGRKIIHFWYIFSPPFDASKRSTNMAGDRIFWESY